MLDVIVIGLIVAMLAFAGRKTLKDLKSSRCSGCTKNCQARQPVNITLKKDKP